MTVGVGHEDTVDLVAIEDIVYLDYLHGGGHSLGIVGHDVAYLEGEEVGL